jgi:glutamate racemase
MTPNPIGILDSGIGGLTITKEIVQLLPNESIVYIGDSANTPYGAKASEEIYARAEVLVQFLLEHNAKIIVIACNTITVNGIGRLREQFPQIPIVGTVPVVKTAAEVSKNKKIGILSTSQTAESAYQKKLIQDHAKDFSVFEHGTDALVPLIERGIFTGEEIDAALQEVLAKFQRENIDTLALGCTHFPLIQSRIQKHMGKRVKLLDPSAAVARHVKRIVENNTITNTSHEKQYVFCSTGTTAVMEKIVAGFVPQNIKTSVKQVTL